jgi:hypothetical protein
MELCDGKVIQTVSMQPCLIRSSQQTRNSLRPMRKQLGSQVRAEEAGRNNRAGLEV